MAKEVDQRVVEMRLQNQQFEQNAKQSIRTLEDLKKASALDGAGKGLDDFEKKARKFSLGSIASDVSDIAGRFSTMGIIGMRALQNITDSAMRTGKALVSAFTIDPVKSGFQEYETQINATQTILANTQKEGAKIEDVNAALNELNKYADMTIYNFTEMTRNIGTFTAAGVDLKTSVSAIKGIANLAAVSGSTSQQASTAMYQLSQALAAGTVKLQDWNSVVNAGMGGQVFQDALKDTARVHGIAIDDMIAKQGSFRETLSKGWLTSKILTETLAKFTGDLNEEQLRSIGYSEQQIQEIIKMGETATEAAQKVKTFSQLIDTMKEAVQSGWTQTWQLLIGDFEEAKELLSKVSDYFQEVIGKSAEARNNMLQSWRDWGGREDLINGLRYAFEGLLSVLAPIRQALAEVFPPMTGFQLAKITRAFMNFAAGMKLTTERADEFRRIFRGVFAVMKAFATITLQLVIGTLDILISAFDIVDGSLYAFAASLGDAGFAMADYLTKGNLVAMVLGLVAMNLDKVAAWVDTIGQSEGFKNFFSGMIDWAKAGAEAFMAFIDRVKAMDGFTLENIKLAVQDFFRTFLGFVKNTTIDLSTIKNAFKSFQDFVHNAFRNVLGVDLSFITDKLQVFFDFAKKIFGQVGLGGIFTIFFGITLYKAISGLGQMNDILGSVTDTMEAFQKTLKSKALVNNAKAILMVAAALALLSKMDQEKLLTSAAVLTVVMGALTAFTFGLSKITQGTRLADTVKVTASITQLSIALIALSAALLAIEKINLDGIGTRLVILGVLMASMVAVTIAVGKAAPQLSKGSFFIIAFALALKVLISALADMDSLDVSGMKDSLEVLLGVIAGLSLVLVAAKNVNTGGALAILSTVVAIKVLVGAFEDLANLDVNSIKKGITAVIGIMAAMAVLAAVMSGGGHANVMGDIGQGARVNVKQKSSNPGLALLAMAAALNLIVVAVKAMAKLDSGEISRAKDVLQDIGVLFIAFTAVTKLAGENAAKAGKALISLAGAMTLIVIPVYIFSTMPREDLSKAVMAIDMIGLMFGAIVGLTKFANKDTTKVLTTLTLSLLALSVVVGAMTMIEQEKLQNAVLAIDAIMLSFGAMMVLTKYVDANKKILKPMMTMVLVVAALGTVLSALSALPVESSIANAVSLSILLLALGASLNLIPNVQDIQTGTLASLGVMTLVIAAIAGILGVLAYLNIEPSIQSSLSLAILLLALAGALRIIPPVNNLAGYQKAILLMVEIAVVMGLLVAAVGAIMQIPGAEKILRDGGEGLILFGSAIGGFIGAIIGGFIGGISAGATAFLPFVGEQLSAFGDAIQPFLEKTANVSSDQMQGIKFLCEALLMLTGVEIIKGITSFVTGSSSFEGFGEGLKYLGKGVSAFYEATKDINNEVVEKAAASAMAIAEFAKAIPNSGGLLGKVVGENDIGQFGLQLAAFAPGFALFCSTIQHAGIEPDTIQAAMESAKFVAAFAAEIPNEGGLLGKIMGENDIAVFGQKLAEFGPYFADYCNAIQSAEIDASIIDDSTNVAKALAAMANDIPNSGGLLGMLFGENDISSFGMKLATFGDYFSDYADAVKDIPDSVADKTVKIADAISALSNAAPESGGIISFFTGDNDLEKFGEKLEGFATYFNSYYEKVKDVGVNQLASVSRRMEELIDISREVASVDPSKLLTFARTLSSLGDTSFTNFETALNQPTKLTELGRSMVNNVVAGVNEKISKFKDLGKNAVSGYVKGIVENLGSVRTAGENMADATTDTLRNKLEVRSPSKVLKAIAAFVVGGYVTGMDGGLPDIRAKMQEMVDTITGTTIDGLLSNNAMVSIGSSAMSGLASGIKSNRTPEQIAKEKADAIAEIFQAGLDQIDLNFNTKDLEYQLWEAMTPGANEATKAQMNMAILTQKIEDLKEKASIYQAQYQTFAEEFGVTDAQTQAKYNELLQAQIELAKLSSELTEAQKTEARRQAEAAAQQEIAKRNYYKYLQDNQHLLEMGIDLQRLQKAAAAESGYDIFKVESAQIPLTVEQQIERAKGLTQLMYDETEDMLDKTLTGGFTDWGKTTAAAIQAGVEEQAKVLQASGALAMTMVATGMEESVPQTTEAAQVVAAATNAVIESDMETAPVIRPVVDTSGVEEGVQRINGLLYTSSGAPLSSAAARGARTASASSPSAPKSNYDQASNVPGNTTNVYYTQNLNAPKSINQTEVYRATKTGYAAAVAASTSPSGLPLSSAAARGERR